MIKTLSSFRAHIAVFTVSLVLDQLTKWWARARFSLPDGEPDYHNYISVIGDWFHLRLVYNHGAAFGLDDEDAGRPGPGRHRGVQQLADGQYGDHLAPQADDPGDVGRDAGQGREQVGPDDLEQEGDGGAVERLTSLEVLC